MTRWSFFVLPTHSSWSEEYRSSMSIRSASFFCSDSLSSRSLRARSSSSAMELSSRCSWAVAFSRRFSPPWRILFSSEESFRRNCCCSDLMGKEKRFYYISDNDQISTTPLPGLLQLLFALQRLQLQHCLLRLRLLRLLGVVDQLRFATLILLFLCLNHRGNVILLRHPH